MHVNWPLQPLSTGISNSNYGTPLLTAFPEASVKAEKNNEKQQLYFETFLNPTNFPPEIYNAQQYFPWHSGLFNKPFTLAAFPSTTQPQFMPQFINGNTIFTSTTTTATLKPNKKKDREPTTKRPTKAIFNVQPPKLQVNVEHTEGNFKNDMNLLNGIREINPEFSIEEIELKPEQHIKSAATHTMKKSNRKSLKVAKSDKRISPEGLDLKVEATGKTSTTGNIPYIAFGTYFLPYFSQAAKPNEKAAALILEPHSKAVVGNGGTAISMPLSKAYLKRGVTTNVYFNPDSVAIAGVGGKAHAQADLELNLIN
uniref:DUF4774 domain-containing protein n=1 Tax=Glossina brevipalpis TaxID=37001 RepID=A0A1A9W7H4_9MUSC